MKPALPSGTISADYLAPVSWNQGMIKTMKITTYSGCNEDRKFEIHNFFHNRLTQGQGQVTSETWQIFIGNSSKMNNNRIPTKDCCDSIVISFYYPCGLW